MVGLLFSALLIQQSNMLQLIALCFPFLLPVWNKLANTACAFLELTGKLRAGGIRRSFENQVMIELARQLPSRKDRLPSKPLAFGIKAAGEGGWGHLPRLGSDGDRAERCPAGGKAVLSQSSGRWHQCPWGRGDHVFSSCVPWGRCEWGGSSCSLRRGCRTSCRCLQLRTVLCATELFIQNRPVNSRIEKMMLSAGSSRKALEEFSPSKSTLFSTGVFTGAEPRVQSRLCLWRSGRMAWVSFTFCSPCEGDAKFPLI